jgi:cyclophilin family peptidyl-prolyl cis-trans isomerase
VNGNPLTGGGAVDGPVTALRSLIAGLALLAVAAGGCLNGSPDPVANPTEPCGSLASGFDLDAAETYAPRADLTTSKGTITLAVYHQQVPVAAGLFLENVHDGTYEETRFHHLEEGSFIQGGDPFSSREDKRYWGAGGTQQVPNEFHQFLRHDRPGMVSQAGGQPNTGGSQFAITLEPLPGLDDRQEVFARVVDGLDVARELSRTETDDQNRPESNAWLHEADIRPPPEPRTNASVSLSSYGYDCEQAAEPGGTAEFLLAARNTGLRLANASLEAQAPGNASVDLRTADADRFPVPSGQTRALIVDVDVPEDAEPGSFEVPVEITATGSQAVTERTLTVNVGPLGELPQSGDEVAVDYVGVLEDGRTFDTTQSVYTEDQALPWFHPRPSATDPVRIPIGDSRLPEGLVNLTERTPRGGSSVAELAPSEAFGANDWGQTGLGGRLLVFQVHVHAGDVDAIDAPSVSGP